MAGCAPLWRGLRWAVVGSLAVVGLLVLLKILYPVRYEREIDHWAKTYGVDPYLVAAVVRAESRFRPRVVSHAGAVGLMQVTPETGEWIAAELGVDGYRTQDLYNVTVNLRFGTWYLRYLHDRVGGDVEAAVTAYNAGLANLRRFQEGEREVSPETRAFVARVLAGWADYRFLYRLPIVGAALRLVPF